MAEIVRTRSTIRMTSTIKGVEDTVETIEHVTVRSIRSDRMTASGLFDFVEALKAAEPPHWPAVEASRSDTGHLTGLTVKWDFKIPEPDEAG